MSGSGKPDLEEGDGCAAAAAATSVPSEAYMSETSGEVLDPEVYFKQETGNAGSSETPDSKTGRKASRSGFKTIKKVCAEPFTPRLSVAFLLTGAYFASGL